MKDLQELMHEAVAGVEPTDRLSAIQARTATPARAARRWWYVAGGVAAATAAAVAVVAVVTGSDPTTNPDHHHEHQVATDPALPDQVVPVYYPGPAPQGEDRLFLELEQVPAGDPLEAALERLQRPPSDPDYRTTWTQGDFESATVSDGTIEVELGAAEPPHPDGIMAQQLVYTLQAATGEPLPVQLVDDGKPVGEPYTAAPELDVLNLVSISDPAEGTAYVGPEATLVARGRASSFEATVPWEVRDEDRKVVLSGFETAEGWMDGLYPWEARIDVSGLTPGFYTFVAETADPSGEGTGVFTDTRTIIVR